MPPLKFNKGDRVRLNEWAWRTYFNKRDRNRLGTVAKQPHQLISVLVKWDGRESLDSSIAAQHLEHATSVAGVDGWEVVRAHFKR